MFEKKAVDCYWALRKGSFHSGETMGEVTKREHSMGLSENTDPESMCCHDFTIFPCSMMAIIEDIPHFQTGPHSNIFRPLRFITTN
jgi:hypothetical protein